MLLGGYLPTILVCIGVPATQVFLPLLGLLSAARPALLARGIPSGVPHLRVQTDPTLLPNDSPGASRSELAAGDGPGTSEGGGETVVPPLMRRRGCGYGGYDAGAGLGALGAGGLSAWAT